MIGVVIGIIVGGLITLVSAHYYYKVSNKKQEQQVTQLRKKLSKDVQKIILSHAKNNLTVRELNKLLEERTIDRLRTNDPLPYKACPKCGNVKLIRNSHFDNAHDRVYYFIKCEKCGWLECSE